MAGSHYPAVHCYPAPRYAVIPPPRDPDPNLRQDASMLTIIRHSCEGRNLTRC